MSTSGSAATAQPLLLYDILLTSGQEYQYIWRAPKTSVSRILYVWNRYMFLLYLILSLGTIPSISDAVRKNKAVGGVALVLSMAPVVINAIAIQPLEPCSYAAGFIDPISSILNSRFLLALRETNARLEGADASISALSLNTGSTDVLRAGSPELPPFLGAIGGPIHSFHHDELESLDFASPSPSEEHQSETEGELMSGGDTGYFA
ncbi:hypothetical protein TRAPUB_3083 [Trametes pubescens]|uniref:DUF6533 domain-containing protein n=1 Tax=Trametes pubescens TaxID=154538 RepID=A0A1M2VF22_TRAPU|nr:hypothetical protein TRAPUB_3083 [Trametes pubescens]